ncbi:Sge1 [Fusarium mundagurra]|uniref:Sge1 n=1 Tax=Fusarium mundagurra TaxID=1567541 RepID=A0A8H6DIQ0_9HYPO|nr:Sge1 [Fusarium mundagurra]
MSGTMPLRPTYQGFVRDTTDALIIFEACLSGTLLHVPRRPHDRERQDLIKSGNIFVYEEHASGIKRWTDSISWSPSRILGNFLIYRELEKPFPPGEKKRARGKGGKSTTQSGGISKPRQRNALPFQQGLEHGNEYPSVPSDEERQLVGSLVDSYDFKEQGLVKKTISITYNGVPHHLVSYYNVEDVRAGLLTGPSDDHRLRSIVPRTELMNGQNFRAPIEEAMGGAYMPGMVASIEYRYPTLQHQSQRHQPQPHQLGASVFGASVHGASVTQMHQPQPHQPQIHQSQMHQPQPHQPQIHQSQMHSSQVYQPQVQAPYHTPAIQPVNGYQPPYDGQWWTP